MKYRSDFVTNSSSSSFLVCFNNTAEMRKSLDKMLLLGVQIQYAQKIFDDIEDKKVTFKEVCDTLKEELKSYAMGRYYYDTSKWQEDFKKRQNNPDIKQEELYRESKELIELVKKYVDDNLNCFKQSVSARSYFSLIEYGDDDGEFYSKLEHEIMPNLPFTIKRFSHH